MDIGYFEHLVATNSVIEDANYIFEVVRIARIRYIAERKKHVSQRWADLLHEKPHGDHNYQIHFVAESSNNAPDFGLCDHQQSLLKHISEVEQFVSDGQSFLVGVDKEMSQWPTAPSNLYFTGISLTRNDNAAPTATRLISTAENALSTSSTKTLLCARTRGGVLNLKNESLGEFARLILVRQE